jgi:DNA-binding response OmpR family regulator
MKQQNILIVEDDESLLSTLTLYLEQSDYEVVAAKEMDSAIQALGATRFDFLIIDLQVGTRRGEEIFYFLGVSLLPPPKKIIAITANPQQLDGSMLGFIVTFVMVKPFRLEDLVENLRAA